MRPLLSLLSPSGLRSRLQIFIFHRVLAVSDPLFPEELAEPAFDRLCGWIRAWFNVLPLDEAVTRLREKRLPARAAAITFDDGYADNHDVALPILQRHGLSATFFIATDFLDGGRMWNDSIIEAIRGSRDEAVSLDVIGLPGGLPLRTAMERRTAIDEIIHGTKYLPPHERVTVGAALARRLRSTMPSDLMMTSVQVRALRKAGQGIGAHTCSHPILARLSVAEAEREIAVGRERLQALLDEPVTLFAYPNGRPGKDYTAENVSMVRRLGFHAAVSTAWGAAGTRGDLFQLPRFTPWDRTKARFGLRLAHNYVRR